MSSLRNNPKTGGSVPGSDYPRTLQVLCIFSEDHYDFQDQVNKALTKLGKDVEDMHMSPSLIPGFSCVISYWRG